MIEREIGPDEAALIAEADASCVNFEDAVERLQNAFSSYVQFTLRERSRLEEELGEIQGRMAGLEK